VGPDQGISKFHLKLLNLCGLSLPCQIHQMPLLVRKNILRKLFFWNFFLIVKSSRIADAIFCRRDMRFHMVWPDAIFLVSSTILSSAILVFMVDRMSTSSILVTSSDCAFFFSALRLSSSSFFAAIFFSASKFFFLPPYLQYVHHKKQS